MSVLIKEVFPLPDKQSVELIAASVTQILQKAGNVVRLVVDARKDNIEYWRVVSEEEAKEKSISFHDAFRQIEMEEYDPMLDGEEKTSHVQLFEMFEIIEDAGLFPSHIVTGRPVPRLRTWLPLSRKAQTIYGVSLHIDGTMEEDVLMVCGSPEREATVADIQYAVKVTLP